MSQLQQHPFPPVWCGDSRILILGSFPSVRSRQEGFYYGHPRNRFWPVLAQVFGESVPMSIEEKKDFLLRHHLALWDVLASCEIAGSSDASVRNPVPNDLCLILKHAEIAAVLCNGTLAGQVYRRFQQPLTGMEAVILPSTSPANAAWSLDKLAKAWKEAVEAALIAGFSSRHRAAK